MRSVERAVVALLAVAATAQDVAAQSAAQTATELPAVTVEGSRKKASRPKAQPRPQAQAPAATQAPQPAASDTPASGRSSQGGTVAAGPISQTPLATQTSAEALRKSEITSIYDLGNTTEPGVEYSKRTDGPSIRGMEGPRVLTVIDGIPIPYLENYARGSTATANAPTNADGGGSAFDFSSLSAVDVLRGADSTRAGPGALGGAIVLRTLEPEDILEGDRNQGALAKLTYDSEDDSIAGALALAARHGPISVLLQGIYRTGHEADNKGSNGSYGNRRTEPNPLDFDQDNLLFKIRHTSNDGHRLGVTAERYSRDVEADLATNWNRNPNLNSNVLPATGFNPFNQFGLEETGRERVSLDYSYLAPIPGGAIETAYAKAYWQELTKSSGAVGTQRNGIRYLRDIAHENETLGFVGGMSGNYATGPLNHGWSVGIDVSDFTATQYTALLPASGTSRSQADIPEVDGTKFGIYVDDRISLGNSRFALTPGLRFDWHEYEPTTTPEFDQNTGAALFPDLPDNSNSRLTPKLLGTYEASHAVELFAQWAAVYRAPTVNELYMNFTNPATGYAQIGNPDLKEETGHGIEIGANVGNDRFGGRLTVYNNWYKNFIVAGDLTPDPNFPQLPFGVGRFENIDEVEISGVELRGHKHFDNGLRVHGALAYAYGEDGDGNLVATIAPFKAVAGIGYVSDYWGVDLTGIFVGRYRDDYADKTRVDNTFDAPSYAIANINAWWEPKMFEGMRLQAGVKNLFDTTYYDALAVRTVNMSAASSQPEEFYSSYGRTYIMSLTQKF